MQKSKGDIQQDRRQIFNQVVQAFGEKYSWLGAQASRELLMSVASWNLQQYSDPPMRYRNHIMLAWKRGFLKSTILRTMAKILGDNNCSVVGKVSDAAMRGSISGGSFSPPKPLRTPIVISTEFGQTDFSDELLNLFLALLEEGHTNIALNKIGALSESQRKNIQNEYDGKIEFKANNEFDLRSEFIFWGATYDPSKLSDDALRSRLNVVTPVKPLDYKITVAVDRSPSVESQLSKTLVRDLRTEMNREKEFSTDFKPPEMLCQKHDVEPRESRDVQSYMASRNWWGLDCNPEVMEDYIKYMQKSRRVSTMTHEERVFDVVFDNPSTYEEIIEETGLTKKEAYKVLQRIDAERAGIGSGQTKWVVWSGDGGSEDVDLEDEEVEKADIFDGSL